jgi:putative transcriptional regulator
MSKSDIFYYLHHQKSSILNRIKEILDEKKLTQVQLCEMIGKSFESVNAYCSNRRQPSMEILYLIANKIGIDVRELLIPNKLRNEHI